MDTFNQMEQSKSRHWSVTIIILLSAVGIIFLTAQLLPFYSALFNYTNWEYGPETYGKEPPEIYAVINTRIFLLLFTAFGSCILLLVFLFKILNWKRSGFWGFVITLAIASVFSVYQLYKIKKSLALINVAFEYKPLIILVFSVLAISLLYGILHFKKSKVSCWQQLE